MIYNWKLRNELDDHVMDANIMRSRQDKVNCNYERKHEYDSGFSPRTLNVIKFVYIIFGIVFVYLIYSVFG